MFLARYPSSAVVERFLEGCRGRPLSYGEPIRLNEPAPHGRILDDALVPIGRGEGDFARAREALLAWKQFDIGWVEVFPRGRPVAAGTEVAVLFRHVGFWSLNGCRILYEVGRREDSARFGFAYGTLTNHAISGEELFEVYLDPASGEVLYRIRATSRPRMMLARLGEPVVRVLQRRFRRDSAEAMRRAVRQ
jgi:uncharacterized protein (UPF0548 family)